MPAPLFGTRQPVVASALAALAVLLAGGCAESSFAVPGAAGAAGGADEPAPGLITAAGLRDGLLGTEKVPAGLAPVADLADEDGARAVFQGAGCAELGRWLNAAEPPGSRGSAAVALSNGPRGGAAAEQLYAMDSPQAAAHVVERYRQASRRCTRITVSVAGAGTSTFSVRPLALAEVGDASFATAVGAASTGSLTDQAIIQVAAHAGAVVIAMTFSGVQAGDAQTVTEAAVEKVRHQLSD